jgi:hypothetical protein
MFVHVAEVMGKHYGMVPIQVRLPCLDLSPQTPILLHLVVSELLLFQHLDLLVRDASHPSKSGQGHVGDILQVSGPEEWRAVTGQKARGLGGKLSQRALTVGGCSDSELSTIYFSEAVWQIPQGAGTAPGETSPLLPPACSGEAVGEQRPRKPRRW